MPFGELWLSGVTIADDQPLADRDLLLRVAKLRAALLERATFIAIRYGFASVPPMRCVEARNRRGGDPHANRDNVEMTLKVAAASPKRAPDRRDQFTTGAGYLRALHESRSAWTIDRRFPRSRGGRDAGAASIAGFIATRSRLELAVLVAPRRASTRSAGGRAAASATFPAYHFCCRGRGRWRISDSCIR